MFCGNFRPSDGLTDLDKIKNPVGLKSRNVVSLRRSLRLMSSPRSAYAAAGKKELLSYATIGLSFLLIATLGSILDSQLSWDLASFSLQDGATKWLYFLSKTGHQATRPPDHLNVWGPVFQLLLIRSSQNLIGILCGWQLPGMVTYHP